MEEFVKIEKKINFALMIEKREEFVQEGRKYLFEIYEKENKSYNNKEMNIMSNDIKEGIN